jgi:hypothetical protein
MKRTAFPRDKEIAARYLRFLCHRYDFRGQPDWQRFYAAWGQYVEDRGYLSIGLPVRNARKIQLGD